MCSLKWHRYWGNNDSRKKFISGHVIVGISIERFFIPNYRKLYWNRCKRHRALGMQMKELQLVAAA